MPNAEVMMLEDIAKDSGAMIAFMFIVITLYGSLLLGALFFLLAVRSVWRWLTRHTWNDVIASAGRRALR
jgi:hypothetical protein